MYLFIVEIGRINELSCNSATVYRQMSPRYTLTLRSRCKHVNITAIIETRDGSIYRKYRDILPISISLYRRF